MLVLASPIGLMAKRTLRLPEELNQQVATAAKDRGFRSTGAFMRAALEEFLRRGETDRALQAIEEKLAASLDKTRTRLIKGQQASIAMINALAEIMVRDHDEFLRLAAEGMNSSSIVKALEDRGGN
jgi:Arc/MetJ-type ribon-helix-helix transcriptional regulator